MHRIGDVAGARTLHTLIALALLAAACSVSSSPEITTTSESATADAEGAREVTPPGGTGTAPAGNASPSQPDRTDQSEEGIADSAPVNTNEAAQPVPRPRRPAAPNGLTAPLVATDAATLARDLEAAERVLRNPAATTDDLAVWGHVHQVSIRKLAREPQWTWEVLAALPESLRATTTLHLEARTAITGLHSGFDRADIVPAWELIEPEPPAVLLGHYLEAEATSGIEWEYLAAINLMETGFGRIRGLSSAGAQGPMQFIPTTWDEVGEGDVNDPRDAIAAAARYLVRRGGPEDMDGALWGYNNSDSYVAAVQAYAEILRTDPAAFTGLWNWQIYFTTSVGEIWLPVGYLESEAISADDHVQLAPWSAPDPELLAPE